MSKQESLAAEAPLQQLSMFLEVLTECRKNSLSSKNEKIEELIRQSAEQQDEIHRLHGLTIERKVEATFEEMSDKPTQEAKVDTEEIQQGNWKRRLSSDNEAESSESNVDKIERFLYPLPKIQLGRKRPKTMNKDTDRILKQKDKEIVLLKSSFERSQKDAEEVLSERKRRINKLEQENLKLRQTIDEKLSLDRFNNIFLILNSLKSELVTRQQLPQAANKENVGDRNESMEGNSEANIVDMNEDETEAVQMAVRDLQHSAEHRDKLEAENVRLLARLSEREAEMIKQKEKLRELEESCSECVQKHKEINDFKTMLKHQEKIILCKSQEIKTKNEEIKVITINANLTKSQVTNLSETVKLKEAEIATQKDDSDSLRKTVSQLEEKCNELEIIGNSLKERISQGDEANQRRRKYLNKFKKYVDKVNDQNEMYLKETVAIRELVKTTFGAHIYSKHGKIRIRMKENCQAQTQVATLSDILSSP